MKILLATDGSEFSTAAVSECCSLITRPESTEIRVLSVYQDMYVLAGEPFVTPPDYLQEIADASKAQAENAAARVEEQIRVRLGDSITVLREVVQGAQPEQRILEEAERWEPDMVVVGSHGKGFLGRMLGTISDAVVHHADCSVLVVWPKAALNKKKSGQN